MSPPPGASVAGGGGKISYETEDIIEKLNALKEKDTLFITSGAGGGEGQQHHSLLKILDKSASIVHNYDHSNQRNSAIISQPKRKIQFSHVSSAEPPPPSGNTAMMLPSLG